MPSLLTGPEKTAIDSVFQDLHETWQQTIVVYQTQVSSIDNSSDYNELYGYGNDFAVNPLPTKVGTNVLARVKYLAQPEEINNLTANLNLTSKEGLVRIKVSSSDKELIENSEEVLINNELFKRISSAQGIGPFAPPNFYAFILQRSD